MGTCPPGGSQLLVVIITMEDIKKAIGEAEKELEVAEKLVASKRSALMVLQKQLQDQLVKNVGGLKGVTSGGDKVNRNETEDERRARVQKKIRWTWRENACGKRQTN